MQCVKRPDISCPSGIARFSRSGAVVQHSMIRRLLTRWCAWLDRTSDLPGLSRQSSTITAGHISYKCRTMIVQKDAGFKRNLWMRFSAMTRTTYSLGLDSAPIQQTINWTAFCCRYDHSQEVSLCSVQISFSSRDCVAQPFRARYWVSTVSEQLNEWASK